MCQYITYYGRTLSKLSDTFLRVFPGAQKDTLDYNFTQYGIRYSNNSANPFWKNSDACISVVDYVSDELLEPFLSNIKTIDNDYFNHYGGVVYTKRNMVIFTNKISEVLEKVQKNPLCILEERNISYLVSLFASIKNEDDFIWEYFDKAPASIQQAFLMENIWAIQNFYQDFLSSMKKINLNYPDADRFTIIGP